MPKGERWESVHLGATKLRKLEDPPNVKDMAASYDGVCTWGSGEMGR